MLENQFEIETIIDCDKQNDKCLKKSSKMILFLNKLNSVEEQEKRLDSKFTGRSQRKGTF